MAEEQSRVEKKILSFVEDLEHVFGQAQSKAEEWLDQRKAVAEQLTKIRDSASALLAQISVGGASALELGQPAARRGRGRPRKVDKRVGRPPKKAATTGRENGGRKRRPMSEETKAKMREAQQERRRKERAVPQS